MAKKIFLAILFAINLFILTSSFTILISPMISAADLTFPFNVDYDIKRPCFNNGTYCDSSFVCNMTYLYPDGDILFNNEQMQFNIAFRNITVSQAQNNKLGIYQAAMTCTDGTISGAETFSVEITGDGNKNLPVPIELIILGFGFVIIGVGTINERLKMFQMLGGIWVMVMGVWTLYPGYANINFSTLPGKVVGFSSIGLGFMYLIRDSFSFGKQSENFDQHHHEEFEDDGRFHG